ncbi:leucine-rich repeat and IQ domain-containing protein 1 isoform X2 [Alligator mississippiensis]|nr:leucine-rich repeat and IQ domain-containing protein 1 isoform X2 [Alligator mississippiensis]
MEEEEDARIAKEIEIELSRINVSSLEADDSDMDLSSEASSVGEKVSDELPESVLYCLNVIKRRSQNSEKLIFQDLEDEEATSDLYGAVSNCAADYLAELASEHNEDPEALKIKVLYEIENEELQASAIPNINVQPTSEDVPCSMITDKHSFTDDGDMTFSFTYHEVEKKCRQEFDLWEKRQKVLENEKMERLRAEKETEEKQNEEKNERRQWCLEEFASERMKLEMLNMEQQARMEAELLKENEVWGVKCRQHEEFIKRLQLQMEKEKSIFEEQQAKERQHLAKQQHTAAVKIQAKMRAFLAYRKYAPILKERKAEIKRRKELKEKMEKEVKEKEEKLRRQMEERKGEKEQERKRQEEIERQNFMEQEKRREEYEKKKASLKFEREKQLQLRQQESTKLEVRITRDKMAENREKDAHNREEEKEREDIKEIREEEKDQKKQIQEIVEEEDKAIKKMQEVNNMEIPKERKLTSPKPGRKEQSFETNIEDLDENSVVHVEKSYSQTIYIDKNINANTLDCDPVDLSDVNVVGNKENSILSSQYNVKSHPDTEKIEHKVQSFNFEVIKTSEDGMGEMQVELTENVDKSDKSTEYSEKSLTFYDDIEKKRLTWMKTCKPWSEICRENQKKKEVKISRPRKSTANSMPPLSIEMIIQSGPWSALQQVTTLTLQDLPGCSLSTLSECTNLQLLTLRRCGITALEGLSNCKDLKYINVEENNIQTINCEKLENLCILNLNKNQLSSVCGLDGCHNLRNLELSYNRITRIGGLESLKNLQQLIVDHNQIISTKGLCDAPTLMHIDCSFNHLTHLAGIENCAMLQILKLQGNNLSEFPRLENHVLLRELCLDDNSILTMERFSLCWLPLLQFLSLSQNSLTELTPLFSCISLEKLDISNNYLSDLSSVSTWFNGCHELTELTLNGNPLLQEKNWRCSILKILPNLRFLNGETLNSDMQLTTERIKESESQSFLAFCQAQIQEIGVLKKKSSALGNAFSFDAAQNQCWYFEELMKVSNEHRYAHEYGDFNITDRDEPEALQNHLKETVTNRLQQNNLFITGAKENKQGSLDPSERWITSGYIQSINSSVSLYQKESNEELRIEQKSTEFCHSPNSEGEDPNKITVHTKRNLFRAPVMACKKGRILQCFEHDGQNLAATIIQSYWRGYVIRRDIHFYTRLHIAATVIQSIWRRYQTRKKTSLHKKKCNQVTRTTEQKNRAATLIQAFWKGFLLRKKLASALAAVKSAEVEDDYEEVNVDDFTFDEAALEREWLTLDSTRFPSKTLLLSNQLHWPKYPKSLCSDGNSHNLPWSPYEAWQCDKRVYSVSPKSSQLSSRLKKRSVSPFSDLKDKEQFSFKSGKEEKISEEWGFKDISTAQLMLKRAHKMKRKRSSHKTLDPAVCLALFKNSENKHPPVKPPRKTQPGEVGYFEGSKEEFVHSNNTSAEKLQMSREFTYQWLHTQVWDFEATSSRNVKCNRFLPDLNPEVCNGGRVQLVASPVSREDTDLDLVSMTSGSALTQNREKNNQAHRHSAGSSKKNISTSDKPHWSPFHKERISFRDHPVQLSGGWGSGKKKTKTLKH